MGPHKPSCSTLPWASCVGRYCSVPALRPYPVLLRLSLWMTLPADQNVWWMLHTSPGPISTSNLCYWSGCICFSHSAPHTLPSMAPKKLRDLLANALWPRWILLGQGRKDMWRASALVLWKLLLGKKNTMEDSKKVMGFLERQQNHHGMSLYLYLNPFFWTCDFSPVHVL